MFVHNGVTPTWIRQIVTALSRKYNVSIKEGKNWAMQPEKKILSYNPKHLLALDRDTVLAILLHELGHLHHTTSKWCETSDIYDERPKAVFGTINALEDIRINELMSRSYQGSRELIDAMNELLGGRGVDSLHRMSEEIKQGRARSGFDSSELHEVNYIAMNKIMGVWKNPDTPYYDQKKIDIADKEFDKVRAAIASPSKTKSGRRSMSSRSLKVPGSPSSALSTT